MTASDHLPSERLACLQCSNATPAFVPSNAHNIYPTEGMEDNLVSFEARRLFLWIGVSVVCQAIDIFGTVTNVINIICFVKQGFRDPVNVSLLGLAISDLGCLLTLVWLNIGLTPAFEEADLPFNAVEVEYLTGGWPHVVFSRVSSWITALITLERCLCVIVPLKVKTLVTPRRVCVIMVLLFTTLIGSVSPVYYANRFAMKFYPNRNKTLLGIVYTHDRESVEKVSFAINNVFVPFTAFMTVLICTLTLVFKLRSTAQWRSTATSSTSAVSNRDQKVAKMVVMISTLFIACFIPVSIIFLAMTVEPDLAVDGKYQNLFLVVFGLAFILESLNSAVNIFIYYRMSSRYRAVFRRLFCSNRCSRWMGTADSEQIVQS